MKSKINICHIYLFIILLTAFNGELYTPGGFIAQGLQYALILMSLYYALYANLKYKLPVYFKALNVLLVMFIVYGVLLVLSGEKLMIQKTLAETTNTTYLKSILLSLSPIYAFYVFGRRGLLKDNTIKFWFFVFLALAIRSFFLSQERSLQRAIEQGSTADEFTSNTGYTFVALLPALVVFYKKPIIQYLGLMICTYFVVIAMKRGAILSGMVCAAWFLITNLKKTRGKRKWIVVLVSIGAIAAVVFIAQYMMETSDYFRYRIMQTELGDSSGRDELYETFYDHFIHENNAFRFMFGYGANGTLKIGDNYAHNDWLEIAINQGILGLVVYLAYWICFYVTWRKTRQHPQAFMAIGMIFIIYFLCTLFSMSYNSVSRCAAMVLGYYLATYDKGNLSETTMVNQ